MTITDQGTRQVRRAELASFLRSRRERVTPADVGLPPGPRRRTPGLRREEVAQLAGVGVTWYTWLEQGRAINASMQVLDAIARVLRLGPAEHGHLYRLADVPDVPERGRRDCLPPDMQAILDALEPLPACVYDGKYDLLAANGTYGVLFPGLVRATGMERNALWQMFVAHPRMGEALEMLPHMVALLRAGFARHLGEPDWELLVARLNAASPAFAEMWATHSVAEPLPQPKSFDCPGVGTVRLTSTSFALGGALEIRMIVYTPSTPADADRIGPLRGRDGGKSQSQTAP